MSDKTSNDTRAVLSNEGTARAALRTSWNENAEAWTSAVREQKIPSRRLATDAAIVEACADVLASSAGNRVLDVGCGEGWLSHALAARGAKVLGIDGSEGLIARCHSEERSDEESAVARGDEQQIPRSARNDSAFEVCSYEALRDDAGRVPGPFDLIVCNFALLDDLVTETLAALRRRIITPVGRVIVHTVHPWIAVGDGAYEDGWRVETFAAFESPFPAHMPWYFRTVGSWIRAAERAGLRVAELREPLHPETRRPLSLLMVLASV